MDEFYGISFTPAQKVWGISKFDEWDLSHRLTLEFHSEYSLSITPAHRKCCWSRTVLNSIVASAVETRPQGAIESRDECVRLVQSLSYAQSLAAVKGVKETHCRVVKYQNAFPSFLQLPLVKNGYTLELEGSFALAKWVNVDEVGQNNPRDHFPPFLFIQPLPHCMEWFAAKRETYFLKNTPAQVLLLETTSTDHSTLYDKKRVLLRATYATFVYKITLPLSSERTSYSIGFQVLGPSQEAGGRYNDCWTDFDTVTNTDENFTDAKLFGLFTESTADHTAENQSKAIRLFVERLSKGKKRERNGEKGLTWCEMFEMKNTDPVQVQPCGKKEFHVEGKGDLVFSSLPEVIRYLRTK